MYVRLADQTHLELKQKSLPMFIAVLSSRAIQIGLLIKIYNLETYLAGV
jgi:hypothetical protein